MYRDHEKTNSFKTGEAANSGLRRIQLARWSARTSERAIRSVLLYEVVEAILPVFKEPRSEPRDNAFSWKLRNASCSIREGLHKILTQSIELGVSAHDNEIMSKGVDAWDSLPFANTHIATFQGAYGAVPYKIGANTTRSRHYHIIIDRD
jgi:hypothetical protein